MLLPSLPPQAVTVSARKSARFTRHTVSPCQPPLCGHSHYAPGVWFDRVLYRLEIP